MSAAAVTGADVTAQTGGAAQIRIQFDTLVDGRGYHAAAAGGHAAHVAGATHDPAAGYHPDCSVEHFLKTSGQRGVLNVRIRRRRHTARRRVRCRT
jgi:hypothetical protein